MDLISVIIPVYNTEKYLDKCVESVVNQSYENLEIILVDDGSTDSCPVKCDKWAEKDSRVKVIHKKNGGLSSARNCGIKSATGTCLCFIDSDDFISLSFIETLFDLLIEFDSDISQCGFKKVFDDLDICLNSDSDDKKYLLDAHDAVKSLITDEKVNTIACNKLLKTEIAKSTLFEENRINEDVLWTYRIIEKSSSVAVTEKQLYFYYQRSGSIMNNSYSEKRFDALYATNERANEILTSFPDLFPLAEKTFVGLSMYHYQWLCRLPKSDEYELFKKRHYDNFINADLKAVFSVTDLKYKIWYTLFKLFPDFTCKIRNTLKIGL